MPRRAGLLFAVLALALSASAAAASAANVVIHFRLGANGRLVVSYSVPAGLDQLKLPANQASLRQKQWRVVKGAATLDDQGIQLKPHTQPVQITLFAKAVTAAPDRVYPLVIPFSDGSLVINTTAFVPANVCKRTVLYFAPGKKDHVVLRGRVYTKSFTVKAFCTGSHAGSYVYLGADTITRHKGFLMVADPGAPRWIARGTREALQTALSNYHGHLGLSLAVRPTVFLGYTPGKLHNSWFKGDTLNFDTVRLSYTGGGWRNESSWPSESLAPKISAAHEAFHFWNTGIKAEQSGPHSPWLKEGGAQLAALLTAKQAGWLSSADFLSRLNGDLQRCLIETGDRSWAALKGRQISGRSYYDCGVTFNFMAAALDNPAHPERGFFKLWSGLLRMRAPAYSIADFLRIATQNSHDTAAPKNLKQAIAGTSGSLSEPIERLFTALKIPVRTVKALTPADIPASAALDSFLWPLLKAVCKVPYHYGFWTRKGYIMVDVPQKCAAFSRTKLLVAVGGSKLTDSPLAAWHEAYAECRDKGTVTFSVLHGDPLSVPCKKSVSKPPRLLRLEAYRGAQSSKPAEP